MRTFGTGWRAKDDVHCIFHPCCYEENDNKISWEA